MIPLNQKVKVIFSKPELDEWGIPVKSPNVKTYKVRLDSNADAMIIKSSDGSNVVYSATIYFKGSVPITYDDFIQYDNGIDIEPVTMTPEAIFPIKDLAGKVTYTKVII